MTTHRAEEQRLEYLFEHNGQFLHGPGSLDNWRIYTFASIDELRFMRDAASELQPEIIAKAKNRFQDAGWEGDGTIQIAWLPPFSIAHSNNTHGVYIIHVKQSNNGISWILSPVSLPCGEPIQI